MTYYNKYKDVEVELPAVSSGLSGEIMMETFKGVEFPKGSGQVFEIAGTRRTALDWSHNLILDQGLDRYAYGYGGTLMNTYCILGTSSTAELVSQTGCIAPIASAGQIYQSLPTGNPGVPPYYGWIESKYRYSPGFGGGNVNINELSLSDSGSNLTERNDASNTRALTRDGNGDPTTVSVLADEYLDVYHRRRQYPGLIDLAGNPQYATGTIDIGGTTHNYSMGPYNVDSARWGAVAYSSFSETGYFYGQYDRGQVYSGDAAHGPVTGFPTASEDFAWFYTYGYGYGEYTLGSYNQTIWGTMGLDQANLTGGLAGCGLFTTRGCYIAILSPAIPKDNTKVFTWYQNFSWNRYTI